MRAPRPPAEQLRLAQTFSFWLPGAGQLYRGRWWRGLAIFTASTVLWSRAFAGFTLAHLKSGTLPQPVLPFAFWCLTWTGVWLWNVRDAGRPDPTAAKPVP